MPPKSLYRQPGAKHFQLVHRSQRDPLIHDPDASKHVLKPVERENVRKGKSRSELESTLPVSEINHDRTHNVGEAASFGIYYDDTEYDYMQHLRAVDIQEDDVTSVLIQAPSSSKTTRKKINGIGMWELPQEALPSTFELPKTYESQQAVPESITGFQPGMDPHLRQVLEALEDDAFVDDDLEDDFFGELVADGERGSDEDLRFESNEDDLEESQVDEEQNNELGWEERFKRFKQAQKSLNEAGSGSEGGDTVSMLPTISVIGAKKRRKGTSDASGYSMSSSSMFRNEALQTLDKRFDQMILKDYNEDGEDTLSSDEGDISDGAPELITSREDFESMMDEFLNDYEILGRKMQSKLAGETGAEKLDTIRRAMGRDERIWLDAEHDEDSDVLMPLDLDNTKDRWDCETILSTYSNVENHPRIISARDPKPVAKILIDPKTGFPSISDPLRRSQAQTNPIRGRVPFAKSENEISSETDPAHRPTISRPRDESKEDKQARKAAIKAERQARRIDKKTIKGQFGVELKTQMRMVGNKEKRLKKL